MAEGVRLYSQETWRLVMGERGREEVAKCAPQVVAYYIEQSKANNHAVREAACACIAELMCTVRVGGGGGGPGAWPGRSTRLPLLRAAHANRTDAACSCA